MSTRAQVRCTQWLHNRYTSDTFLSLFCCVSVSTIVWDRMTSSFNRISYLWSFQLSSLRSSLPNDGHFIPVTFSHFCQLHFYPRLQSNMHNTYSKQSQNDCVVFITFVICQHYIVRKGKKVNIITSAFLPTWRYASAVFATATCLSVRRSVCHTPVLCLAERKQDREMYTIW